MDNISNLFGFLGGIGMFLYGMHIMADGMQKTAGGKMQKFLNKITNNPFMGVLMGTAITAIVQSSAATTVMVVGFVSAGILTLNQAVAVIMGANIGTTVTAWIVSINQLGDAVALLSPDFYAPLIIGIGALIILFAQSSKKKTAGEIIMGLGLLFFGLKLMSSTLKPYTDMPIFSEAFVVLGKNPILAIIVGCVVTALIQSSSASVGILQTLAINGVVTTSSAIYITLGQNIGTCITALISSMGSKRIAKRAAIIHLLFNTLGAVIFAVGGFIFFSIFKNVALGTMNAVEISIFHTFFNITNTLILFPFSKQLVKLSGMIVKEDAQEKKAKEENEDLELTLRHLDNRILESPAFAVETAIQEVVHMGEYTLANVKLAMDSLITKDKESVGKVFASEKIINKMQNKLIEYLIKVDNLSLNEEQKLLISNLFYTVSDIERAGDHAENLAENTTVLIEGNLKFSDMAIEELKQINDEVYKALYNAIEARRNGDLELVRKVSNYEDNVDNLEAELREKHISRLSKGECVPESGIYFLEIISNLERIADHATNIAGYIKKEI